MDTVDRWGSFWSTQRTALEASDSADFYARYAREIKWLLDDLPLTSVLDVGCGNGALYRRLGFDKCKVYRGVDLSAQMLDEFTRTCGAVDLVCASGHDWKDDRSYDLIFSNGAVQYFDRAMFRSFMSNARQMLAPSGAIVLGAVPWRALRWHYRAGDLRPQNEPRFRSAARWAYRLFNDTMQYWYSFDDMRRIARTLDLNPSFYGSLTHPYRFNVILKSANATVPSAVLS